MTTQPPVGGDLSASGGVRGGEDRPSILGRGNRGGRSFGTGGRLFHPENFDIAVGTSDRDPHLSLPTRDMSMYIPVASFVDKGQSDPDFGIGPGLDPFTRGVKRLSVDVNSAVSLAVTKAVTDDSQYSPGFPETP